MTQQSSICCVMPCHAQMKALRTMTRRLPSGNLYPTKQCLRRLYFDGDRLIVPMPCSQQHFYETLVAGDDLSIPWEDLFDELPQMLVSAPFSRA